MKIALRLISLFIIVGLLVPSPVLALDEPENTVGFENVQLWVYAEYDDPYELGAPLLVMLEGQITGATPPVEIRFPVPAGVVMYSAGYKDAQGNYRKGYDYDGPPVPEASGIQGWDIITITLQTTTFRVEYYDPDIIIGNKDKTISYQFRWLYPIKDLTAIVQAPLKASNFEVSPAGQPGSYQGNDYHLYQFSNLPFTNLGGQQPIEFAISYSIGGSNVLLVTGIIIGVFAVFTAIYFWMKRGSRLTRAERRRSLKSKQPARQSVRPAKDAISPRFCRHCGHQLERPSQFCPQCGGSTG